MFVVNRNGPTLPHHQSIMINRDQAQHSSSYSGPRDTMIKGDPSDETPPPPYGPPVMGTAPGHVVTAPLLDRFHHPHVDPSPSVAAPIAGPKPYGPYNGFPPQARGPYQSTPYSSSSFAAAANAALGKKKVQRATQACNNCRTHKAKCDEGRPHCGSCKDKGNSCGYPDPPPKQYAPFSL
jgi:hypothetical protein